MIAAERTNFISGLVALFVVVACLFVAFLLPLREFKDVNPEALDLPVTVSYLQEARHAGIAAHDYWLRPDVMTDLKQENPKGAHAYFKGAFQFDMFTTQCPILNLMYVPIIKVFGTNSDAVRWYSIIYGMLALILVMWAVVRLYGPWVAALSGLFLFSSVIWLIHLYVAYSAWMPSLLFLSGNILLLTYYRDRQPGLWVYIVAGVLLGLLYLIGWLSFVFALILTLLALMILDKRSLKWRLTAAMVYAVSAVITACAVVLFYCQVFGCSFMDVHSGILMVLFGRYGQGAVPGVNPTLSGKIVYVFRELFVNSDTIDHKDKCLEGHPAIQLHFTVCFLLGLIYAVRDRTTGDKIMLLWLVSVFVFLGTAFMYAHRYAILVMPAMAVIAARGVYGLCEDAGRFSKSAFKALLVVVLGLSVIGTSFAHKTFSGEYMKAKKPDFEVDRIRGHYEWTEWVKKNTPEGETLVVMSDPIMFGHTCYLFYMYGHRYDFKYWCNYFNSKSTPDSVKLWEAGLLKKYSRIVYLFSPVLLGGGEPGMCMNDPRPFFASHPDIKPETAPFVYSYAGRNPMIFLFVVERK